ncbi:MAG TPA: HPr family phosphocarrier protein [Anaerovoracaceae bacterium]|nr:HPr family phosphocarrier protein [Anaerovoracaceae bacterium]
MKSFEYVIKEEVGIHARPASLLVKAATAYNSRITIEKAGKKADVKSLLTVMALGVKYGDKVTFFIEGGDEALAAKELETFCKKTL